MLKIKDDVDLKELEKFGFIRNKDVYDVRQNRKHDVWYKLVPNDDYNRFETSIIINPVGVFEKNEIIFGIENTENIIGPDVDLAARLDVLYDLIQAGLVERDGVVWKK